MSGSRNLSDEGRLQRMQEEHRQLRQELETNRRFVFERPLLIAGAGFAGYAGLSSKLDLRPLPIPVLAVLLFNLWFTYNRLRSNARIISYIQLVHDPEGLGQWIGWESALRRYRMWLTLRPDAWRLVRGRVRDQHDSMGFYAPILWFHIALGVIVCALVMVQENVVQYLWIPGSSRMDQTIAAADIIALTAYASLALLVPSGRLRMAIEECRYAWEQVLVSEDQPLASAEDHRRRHPNARGVRDGTDTSRTRRHS